MFATRDDHHCIKALMTHKYRGCIVVLSINKSVEPNKEQKVLASNLDQKFTLKLADRFSVVSETADKNSATK